jgi:flagellar protein FliO/FliZ
MIILTAVGTLDSFVQFITILLLFLFVLVITYVVTRWVSGVQKIQMTGKNMELVETMRISNSKYLQIVRAGEKYLVIAVCKDTVTMLTELSVDEVSLGSKNEVNGLSFREIMDKVKHQKSSEK